MSDADPIGTREADALPCMWRDCERLTDRRTAYCDEHDGDDAPSYESVRDELVGRTWCRRKVA